MSDQHPVCQTDHLTSDLKSEVNEEIGHVLPYLVSTYGNFQSH